MSKDAARHRWPVQMDGDHNQQNFSMWVDQMQVTAW
jgi:hypothetical protein